MRSLYEGGHGGIAPTLNYQLSIDRERGRSHYNYQSIDSQLSTLPFSIPRAIFLN
ncbi:MAG: hypothetical protein ACRC62_34690 [Microcoleus sp.]